MTIVYSFGCRQEESPEMTPPRGVQLRVYVVWCVVIFYLCLFVCSLVESMVFDVVGMLDARLCLIVPAGSNETNDSCRFAQEQEQLTSQPTTATSIDAYVGGHVISRGADVHRY